MQRQLAKQCVAAAASEFKAANARKKNYEEWAEKAAKSLTEKSKALKAVRKKRHSKAKYRRCYEAQEEVRQAWEDVRQARVAMANVKNKIASAQLYYTKVRVGQDQVEKVAKEVLAAKVRATFANVANMTATLLPLAQGFGEGQRRRTRGAMLMHSAAVETAEEFMAAVRRELGAEEAASNDV